MKCLYCGKSDVVVLKIKRVLHCDSKTQGIKKLAICIECWHQNVFGKVTGIELKNWCMDRIATLKDDGTIADYYFEGV